MRVLAFIPVVAAVQVMDSNVAMHTDADTNYEGMKNTLKSIAAMQAKGAIDQNTIESVTQMLKTINTELLDALEQDVTHSQTILNTAWNAVEACDTAKTTWASTTHSTWSGNVSSANSAHSSCRNNDEATECANAVRECDAFTGLVCNWNDCDVPGAGRFSGGDTDEVNTYMNCLLGFMTTNKASFEDKRQKCIDATNTWNAKSNECDGLQGDYESEFCDKETNTQNACESYRLCRDRTQGTYHSIFVQTEGLEDIYQAQRVALQCLLCYGEHILNNSTDLSSCDSPPACASLSECPTITYTDLPPCIACSEPDEVMPCTPDFISTYYGQYENTCTPPAQCSACGAGAQNTEGSQTCATYPPA